MEEPRIQVFKYDEERSFEQQYDDLEEALEKVKPGKINWINIDGLHNTELIARIGSRFNISPLILANVVNTGHRPKCYEDEGLVAIITKAIYFDLETGEISVEQISFILIEDVLISLQERIGDHFEPVRNRIRNKTGKLRHSKADYLLYALMDSLVDNYLIAIEEIGRRIEDLEPLLASPEKKIIDQLFHHKTEITFFRKTLRPIREIMPRLIRAEVTCISPDSHRYFQELNDLMEQAIDATETYFIVSTDQINLYNTNVSNRANDVMKVLTIFASIFIPLTFIAGIYGTNFDYIPELTYRYGYFMMWAVMVLVAVTMLYLFKKNKWF
ncbi:UNVERIFIED_CONTAM: hypothetical protein GTU68_065797 [Idotea baltica]|nr:hypothetical protein [Idotea baltica]